MTYIVANNVSKSTSTAASVLTGTFLFTLLSLVLFYVGGIRYEPTLFTKTFKATVT